MIELDENWTGESSAFIEGFLLATNISPEPLSPEKWLMYLQNDDTLISQENREKILAYQNHQYERLTRHQYALPETLALTKGNIETSQIFARGFLTLWPLIERLWQKKILSDGGRRMLSGLITTFYLLLDEEDTLKQMQADNVKGLDSPEAYYKEFNTMINEVALEAEQKLIGLKAKAINPFRKVGRNDPCPCNSGKKFKKCCGRA